MTSIGRVSRSARVPYECNECGIDIECDVEINASEHYLRNRRSGYVLTIHLHCAIPLIQHGWIYNMRLPNGEELDNKTTPERWGELIATT